MQGMRFGLSIRVLISTLMMSGLLVCALAAYLLMVAPPASSPLHVMPDSRPDISPLLTRLVDYQSRQQPVLLARTEKALQSLEAVSAPQLLGDELDVLEHTAPSWLDALVVADLKNGDRQLQNLRHELMQAISQRVALEGQNRFLRDSVLESSRDIERQIQALATGQGDALTELHRLSARLPILVGGFLQAENPAAMRKMAQQQIAPLLSRMRELLSQVSDGKDELGKISKALAGLARRFESDDSSIFSLANEEHAASQKVHGILEKTQKEIRSQFELLSRLVITPKLDPQLKAEPVIAGKSNYAVWLGLAILLSALLLMAGIRALMRLPGNENNQDHGSQGKLMTAVSGFREGQEYRRVAANNVDDAYLDEFLTAAKQHVRSLHSIYLRMGEQLQSASQHVVAGEVVANEHLRETGHLHDSLGEKSDALEKAQALLRQSSQAAQQGSRVLQESLDVMQEVSKSCDQISDAINSVEAIAFEINLLSLNATVEAAHAGDHGNGFAVVASEVRDLAQRSTDSANNIKALIETSIGEVRTSQELITRSSIEIMTVVESTAGAGAAIEQAGAGEQLQRESMNAATPDDQFAEFEKAGKALDYHSNRLRGLISGLEHRLERAEKGCAA